MVIAAWFGGSYRVWWKPKKVHIRSSHSVKYDIDREIIYEDMITSYTWCQGSNHDLPAYVVYSVMNMRIFDWLIARPSSGSLVR